MPRFLEPNPLEDDELYAYIILGPLTSPGQCKLSGHDREMDWDIKVGAGQTGATTTLKASKPAEFSVILTLSDIEEFNAWPQFRELVESTVKGKGKALDIYHPDLAANGITSVVMKSISGVVHDGKGGQVITIKFLEYKPPRKVAVTPLGSRNKGPDPNAEAKAKLAALVDQNNRTPWGTLF